MSEDTNNTTVQTQSNETNTTTQNNQGNIVLTNEQFEKLLANVNKNEVAPRGKADELDVAKKQVENDLRNQNELKAQAKSFAKIEEFKTMFPEEAEGLSDSEKASHKIINKAISLVLENKELSFSEQEKRIEKSILDEKKEQYKDLIKGKEHLIHDYETFQVLLQDAQEKEKLRKKAEANASFGTGQPDEVKNPVLSNILKHTKPF